MSTKPNQIGKDDMIDLTIDFNSLLEEAKAKHKAYVDIVDPLRTKYDTEKLCYPSEVEVKLKAAYTKWADWVDKNITARELKLATNALGSPIGIFACLAGHF